jgi:hypothetical protein
MTAIIIAIMSTITTTMTRSHGDIRLFSDPRRQGVPADWKWMAGGEVRGRNSARIKGIVNVMAA